MEFAVDGAQSAALDPKDAFGDQAGVGPLDGVVEIRRDDQPLAARLVVGPQLLAQDQVRHVVLEIGTGQVLQRLKLG